MSSSERKSGFELSLVAFFADALSIVIGAVALGGAVAGIVVLLLDGPSAIRGRMLDAPFIHPASHASDDLAATIRERCEIGKRSFGIPSREHESVAT
jgi:hypothetical protein